MEASRLQRMLDSRAIVPMACGVTLALGLFFLFVWAPHPWGREGFDHYHQLALSLAEGQPFPTMEVPWGYAYFLALFYRLFGDHPVIPLLVQVALNALVPLLVFVLARSFFDRRIAAVAALVTAVFSFNTVYASTQSSDAVCTVVFMTALFAFVRARRSATSSPGRSPLRSEARSAWRWYVLAGVLTGLAPQFRPNLILIPALLAGYTIAEPAFARRWSAASYGAAGWRRVAQAAVMLGCAAAMLVPWVARNYRLTGLLLPTSVHGGVQLWYGTLQVGPYLHSRAYNPRAVFEAPVFQYTSLATVPLIVSAQPKACAEGAPTAVSLVYWTDRDRAPQVLAPAAQNDGRFTFEVPPPNGEAVVYYYFETQWASGDAGSVTPTPALADAAPFVHFVSREHLGDLDRHGDLLDVFDVIRLVRREAWGEEVPFEERLAAAGVNTSTDAAAALWTRTGARERLDAAHLTHDDRFARLAFGTGGSIGVPRAWNGRITEIDFDGAVPLALMHATMPLSARRVPDAPLSHDEVCRQLEEVTVNDVFFRNEPHLMRRYSALAFDNIRREPLAFARASAYRALRLFVIQGSDDRHTAFQFRRSSMVYLAATIASAAYFVLFAAGVVLAWRRQYCIALPLLLILYLPATISFVLTNMRYSITVQPLVFMFVAVTLTTLAERARLLEAHGAVRGPGGTRTARQL